MSGYVFFTGLCVVVEFSFDLFFRNGFLFHVCRRWEVVLNIKVADLLPIRVRKQSHRWDMDLNIGFQGLALIQGQSYNPEIEEVQQVVFQRAKVH